MRQLPSTRALVIVVIAGTCLFAALASYFSVAGDQTYSAWSVHDSNTGVMLAWNRDTAELRNASALSLIIRDGGVSRDFKLNGQSGTIVYQPQSPNMDMVLKGRYAAGERTFPVYARGNTAPPAEVTQQPAADFSSRSRTVSARPKRIYVTISDAIHARKRRVLTRTRNVVVPETPSRIKQQMTSAAIDIEVFVKINETGKVSAASTRFYSGPIEKQLAELATSAAFQWSFDPVSVKGRPVYSDAKLRFHFPRS